MSNNNDTQLDEFERAVSEGPCTGFVTYIEPKEGPALPDFADGFDGMASTFLTARAQHWQHEHGQKPKGCWIKVEVAFE